MNTTVINIRTDAKLKSSAQKVAENLGLSLSALINGFLKHLIKTKKITFSVKEEPSDYLIKSIKEAEEDWKKGNYYSFKNPKDALKFLDKINKKK
ncbi:hypothetical protein A3A46_00895 [Candidatus Roizmanbacteria bacterium RIFCSPLOWO2_01_FULL_37_13]|uniref:Damage-inducible protein J n=1 Tax=Candidatus Roizmanbacteria bacterium RIFCSPHIGHO2_02_FULL_38_11 TaxID=1802039 RepID=A0A1F7H1C1_9BACT|nr:MAG: hypothetical protein A3C25_02705 [Candidatus Roizmanbacteria bacterium RIFCSPHIGHO2_02_FULL_38_11]OGK41244.1 MAG: hypothetical protein A3A46_00895 [Candidatus Roizmanbacteria bacterium RIFCSPLOWO2_01_FULL_37_13]